MPKTKITKLDIERLAKAQKFVNNSKKPVRNDEIYAHLGIGQDAFKLLKWRANHYFSMNIYLNHNMIVKMEFDESFPFKQVQKNINLDAPNKKITVERLDRLKYIIAKINSTPEPIGKEELAKELNIDKKIISASFNVLHQVGGIRVMRGSKYIKITVDLNKFTIDTRKKRQAKQEVTVKISKREQIARAKNTVKRLKNTICFGIPTHTEFREFNQAKSFLRKMSI